MPAGVIVGFLLFERVVLLPTPSRWVARNSSTAVVSIHVDQVAVFPNFHRRYYVVRNRTS